MATREQSLWYYSELVSAFKTRVPNPLEEGLGRCHR